MYFSLLCLLIWSKFPNSPASEIEGGASAVTLPFTAYSSPGYALFFDDMYPGYWFIVINPKDEARFLVIINMAKLY